MLQTNGKEEMVHLVCLHNRKGIVVNNALCDLDLREKIKFYSWHKNSYGYAQISKGGETFTMMYRFIIQLGGIILNVGDVVNHINYNHMDNKLSNLRVVIPATNALNHTRTDKMCSSCFLGISCYTDGTWSARFQFKYLGHFSIKEAAGYAYNQARTDTNKWPNNIDEIYKGQALKRKHKKDYVTDGIKQILDQDGQQVFIAISIDSCKDGGSKKVT